MARLFVAVDVPAAIAEATLALRAPWKGTRWVVPEQMHLTLRFMGAAPDDAIGEIQRALETVKAPAFALGLRGVGVFPPPRKRKPPHVLWAGVEPLAPLEALKQAIDAALEVCTPLRATISRTGAGRSSRFARRGLGPDPEARERGFHPHLTLARFREAPGAPLAAFLEAHAGFDTPPWPVQEFRLYRSQIGPEGARHDLLSRHSLGTARP
jgi:2'-5' RNA ligase